MAFVSITFDDFDTACYSNLHNIIQLIEKTIGVSIQVEINTASVTQLETKVDDVEQKAQEGHDAFLLAENLNRRVSTLEGRVSHIEDYDDTFLHTNLGQQIIQMNKDIKALEEAVFGG